MSMANATSVMSAAKNDTSDASNVTVTCVEKDRRSATNVTPVAI